MKGYLLALAMISVFPAGNSALADELNLPGHTLSAKKAEMQANNVFLGELVGLDPVNGRKGDYMGKVINISRPANGITPMFTTQYTTTPTSNISSDLSFPVSMKVAANERAPEVGRSYLFYGKDSMFGGVRGYEALKLTPTAEHDLPKKL